MLLSLMSKFGEGRLYQLFRFDKTNLKLQASSGAVFLVDSVRTKIAEHNQFMVGKQANEIEFSSFS